MASSTPIPGYLVREYAAKAQVHPKSIRRFFSDPESMKPIVRARIEQTLRKLGVLSEEPRR